MKLMLENGGREATLRLSAYSWSSAFEAAQIAAAVPPRGYALKATRVVYVRRPGRGRRTCSLTLRWIKRDPEAPPLEVDPGQVEQRFRHLQHAAMSAPAEPGLPA